MAALKGTIKLYLSGGADNSDPALSLGGVISSTLAPTQLLGNVSWQKALTGMTDYLCVYLKNTNSDPLDIAADMLIYIAQQLTGDDDINIQVDPEGVGNGVTTGVATIIADRESAPAGVTFPETVPVGKLNALPPISLIGPGECIAIWIKRTVPESATSKPVDQGRLGFAWGF